MSGQDDALGGLLSLKQMRLHEFPADATRKITKVEVQTLAMKYFISNGDTAVATARKALYYQL